MLLLLLACTADSDQPVAGDSDSASADDTQDWGPAPDPWCSEPGTWGYADVGEGILEVWDEDTSMMESHPIGLIDVDLDGDDDLLIADRMVGLYLQRNLDGALGEPELLLETGKIVSFATADVEGDGDLDLWVGGYAPDMRLLLNDGEGNFTDETATSGLPEIELRAMKRDAVFGDYDGDGDMDLYVAVVGQTETDETRLHKLLQNDGTGFFVDVSEDIDPVARLGVGWSSQFADFDNDGDQDLYTANAEQSVHGPSRLLRNDGAEGEGWGWEDVSEDCQCDETGNPMGVSIADFDHDGLWDLLLTNTTANELFGNVGGLVFVEMSAAVPDLVMTEDFMTYGAAWMDLDNDGWHDAFLAAGQLGGGREGLDEQPDMLLMGHETGMTNKAEDYGLADVEHGRGVAYGMWNDDGFPDLAVNHVGGHARLYQAQCTENRALVVELQDEPPNVFGVGARVVVETDAGSFMAPVTTEPGWAGAVHPRAWVGLGEGAVRSVTVVWPDSQEQAVDLHPQVDGRITVERE